MRSAPLRVWLVCSGLEHAHRGYETFARECFDQLRGVERLDLSLVKGSGDALPGERAVRAARRDRTTARIAGRVAQIPPYRIEAWSFGLALAPALARTAPELIYVSEWDTARVLARLRPLLRSDYRLLLANGGFAATGFDHLDHVQELTPAARDHVLARGADPARHSVLPYGFAIPPELSPPTPADVQRMRAKLGLPQDRPVILSVAALNRSHKRLDHLIKEVARLPPPRPYLLLAGEPDHETPAVKRLAERTLGAGGFDLRTVPAATVDELHRASDVFVLASTAEMQGRALVEAAAGGMPCVAHDSPIMRFAAGPSGFYGDLTQPGVLSQLMKAAIEEPAPARTRRAIAGHRQVYERFSWERLRPRYVALFDAVGRANSTVSSSIGE